jgi:hypothetical protein
MKTCGCPHSVVLEEMCCLVGFFSDNGTFTRILLYGWDLVRFNYIPYNKVSSFYNFTLLFDYSNTCIIFLIWQIQMYKLINFEKCLDSSMRNVNSKFLFIKMNNINGRYELLREVIKNTIFYDMISCSLIILYHHSGGMCHLHVYYRRASLNLWDISKFLLGCHFTKFHNQNNVLLDTKCLFAELLIGNGPIHKNCQCHFRLWQQNSAWILRILGLY